MRRAGSSPSRAERRLAGVASPPAVCARLASPLPASLRSRGACSGSRRRASSTAAAAEHGTWLPPGPTRLALIVGRPNGRTSRGCFTVRVTGRPNRGCGSGPFADPVTTRPDRRTGDTSVVRWVASRPDDLKRVASVGSRCRRPARPAARSGGPAARVRPGGACIQRSVRRDRGLVASASARSPNVRRKPSAAR
jgi:hypothetical protein